MEISKKHLRESYAQKETHQLLELRASGNLTEIALLAIDEEINSRGVDGKDVTKHEVQIEKKKRSISDKVTGRASILTRIIAWLFDFFGAAGLIFGLSFFIHASISQTLSDQLSTLFILSFFGYLLFKDAGQGRSVGKWILGIKVLDLESGRACTAPQSFIRNFLHILGVIDWIFIFGKGSRRLGDIAAKTCVVRDNG